ETGPRPLNRSDPPGPLRVGVVPGTVASLTSEHLVGAVHGDLSVALVAQALVEHPVREGPVGLSLQVVEVVPPRHEREVTLDESAGAIVEADARVGSDQRAAAPVPSDQVSVQIQGCFGVLVHGLISLLICAREGPSATA